MWLMPHFIRMLTQILRLRASHAGVSRQTERSLRCSSASLTATGQQQRKARSAYIATGVSHATRYKLLSPLYIKGHSRLPHDTTRDAVFAA